MESRLRTRVRSSSTQEASQQQVNCPVCGGRGISSGIFCDTVFGRPQSFLRCPNCQVLFDQLPRLPEYAEGYYASNPLQDFKLYLEKAASLRLFAHLILTAERALQVSHLNRAAEVQKGKLLEIGCGPGLLLDIARFHGWEPVGLDPNKEAACWARETLKLPIRQEPLGIHPPLTDAEIVIAAEVIEHLESPHQFAKSLYDALEPRGIALLTTPNAESLELVARDSSWVYLGMGYHLALYSSKALEAVLHRAGFKTVQVWTFEGDERLLAVATKAEVPSSILRAVFQSYEQDKEAIELCTQYLWSVRSRFENDKNPYWQGAFFRLVEVLAASGKYSEALQVADQLGEFLRSSGCTEKHVLNAIEEAAQTKHRPDFYAKVPTFVPNFHFLRGLALLNCERQIEALKEFQAAYNIAEKLEKLPYKAYEELVTTPPSLTYLFYVGFTFLKQGKASEALAVFSELRRQSTLGEDILSQVLLNQATALDQQGKFQSAAENLQLVSNLAQHGKLPPSVVGEVARRLPETWLKELKERLAELQNQLNHVSGLLEAEKAERSGLEGQFLKERAELENQLNHVSGLLEAERVMRGALEGQFQFLRYRIADKMNAFLKKSPALHRIGKSVLAHAMERWKRARREKILRLSPPAKIDLHPAHLPHTPIPPVPRQAAELGACTIIAKNYLSAARVLATSFRQHNPSCPFFVLLVDRVDGYFDPSQESFLTLEADSLEIPNKRELFFKYNVLEVSTAVKPYLVEHLFRSHDIKKLLYLDPDILIMNDLARISSLLDAHSIILTPHLTTPITDAFRPSEFQILQAGTYNLGFIALSNSEVTQRLLAWWQAKLQNECFMAPERGMHVDQKWIDLVPGLFGDTCVLRDPGCNVAYWNLHERRVTVSNNEITINDEPAYFFHFSGFDPNHIDNVSKHQDRFRINDIGDAKLLFERYRDLLLTAGWEETKAWPYSHNYFDNGVPIPDAARRLYASLGDQTADLEDPFATGSARSFFAWLNKSIDSEKDPSRTITRLWNEIYQQRSDVRSAYPDVLGAHRSEFLTWIRSTGRHECKVHPNFLPLEQEAPSQQFKSTVSTQQAPPPFGVNVMGYANSEKGTGEAMRATLRSLRAADIPHVINNVSDIYGSKNQELVRSAMFSDGNPYAINLFHINADQVPELVRLHKGRFVNRYNIGFWNWELSSFPQQWAECFQPFDEILVPSNFVRDAIAPASPVPVTIVPYSLDPEMQPRREWTRARFGIAEDSFVFSFLFDFYSYMERKNPIGLVQAFKVAFGNSEDVTLFIKSSHSDFSPTSFELLKQVCKATNIKLYDEVLPREAINSLLSISDCYVSLHRSEGFGLTLSEAMHMGTPVIATAYSGNMDFMREDNSFLVSYKEVEIERDHGPYKKGCVWADPDLNRAAELMRYVCEHREAGAAVGRKGREDVTAQLYPMVVGQMLQKRLMRATS